MIRAIAAYPDGTKFALLGLTSKSLEKMVRHEQPIVINLSRLGDPTMPDVDITLFYATDDAVQNFIHNQQAIEAEGEPHDDDPDNDKPRRRKRR